MPLHPLFVHFPLVFAVLAPIAVCYAIFVTFKNEARSRVWVGILVLHFFLTASAFVSMHFGEEDEERVEKVVSEQVIEDHEELGELLAWGTLGPLGLSLILIFRRNNAFKGLLLASSIGLLTLSILTGHSGAELVYRHNAAKAYSGTNYTATSTDQGSEHTDDD